MANAPDHVDHAWKLMEKITFCMLTTRDDEDLRSRPMAAYVRREEGRVYFLTDAASHKDEEIARDPHVNLAFADAGSQKFVSVTGRAEISSDRQKIRELWGTPAKAWWDSPDDPAIRVLKIALKDAQYWDSPGTVVSCIKLAAAAATNTRPTLGDSAKVDL